MSPRRFQREVAPGDLAMLAADILPTKDRWLFGRWQTPRDSPPDPVAQPKAEIANTRVRKPDVMEEPRHTELRRKTELILKR